MHSKELNYMAKTLADIYFIDKEAKTDELMEELIRVATLEGIPDNELTAAEGLYSKEKEEKDPIWDIVRTNLIDACLDDLFTFIKRNQGKRRRDATYSLYSTLLDHWRDILEDKVEQQAEDGDEESKSCGNCMWRTKKGHRCSNMASGYYPDSMDDNESCVEWEANPAS